MVIYAASTVGLEAVIAGIPVIRFVPSGSPSVDVIPETLAVMASTRDFLGERIREIIISKPPVVDKRNFRTPESRIVARCHWGSMLTGAISRKVGKFTKDKTLRRWIYGRIFGNWRKSEAHRKHVPPYLEEHLPLPSEKPISKVF